VSRIWLISTWLYLVGYLVALGFSTGGTFMGAMSPLQEILAAPIFLSSGGWGICRGVARAGSEIDRSKHPVSFWVTTIGILCLGLMLLVWGLQDLGKS
jgi:hypothetical protein